MSEKYDGFMVSVRNEARIRAIMRPVKDTPAAQALLHEIAVNGVYWERPHEADLPALADYGSWDWEPEVTHE